ncbi:MAG: methionine biosynthesis protein MetW [Alphaproteobacteria bacterium]|nr:methionine biosynthesis protein MetW [Alphaproteobacteria bacterium]MDP6589735.1 methionine biosynthesis protein MetW [Alphaproteobacteria bacterium]
MAAGNLPAGIDRPDLSLIAEMVAPGARVLDVGCGDGLLLELLSRDKGIDGRGIEISQQGVSACVGRGLSVIQGNAETDLNYYPDGAFDYVILSLTLPALHQPREILLELLRVGRRAIVSIPNSGFWRHRLYLLLRGRVPDMGARSAEWFDTPNLHPCTIRDFVMLCRALGIVIERRAQLDSRGRANRFHGTGLFANLFGEQAVFLLSMKG